MVERRRVLKGLSGLGAACLMPAAGIAHAATRYEPVLTEDGLYTQPWFLESFLEMADDLAEAAAAGKRLVVMWEQKGCPYCKEMHQVNLARPDVHEYVRDNFTILQLNLWGSREVTDFDGKAMEERELARRWRVNFTPTLQFFPPTLAGVEESPGMEIEVARMPGYFKPFHFMAMFEFVKQQGYASSNFQRFLQVKFEQLKAKGVDPDVW